MIAKRDRDLVALMASIIYAVNENNGCSKKMSAEVAIDILDEVEHQLSEATNKPTISQTSQRSFNG